MSSTQESGNGDGRDRADAPPSAEQARAHRGASMSTRWGSAGIPTERSSDFGLTIRRLLGEMQPERLGAIAVVVLAVLSVGLYVLGPRVLGEATNTIVDGVLAGGIDFDRLARILAFVLCLYLASAALSYLQAWVLTGVVQRDDGRYHTSVIERIFDNYQDRYASDCSMP